MLHSGQYWTNWTGDYGPVRHIVLLRFLYYQSTDTVFPCNILCFSIIHQAADRTGDKDRPRGAIFLLLHLAGHVIACRVRDLSLVITVRKHWMLRETISPHSLTVL